MQIKRKELIDALELCKPAISTTNRADELTHFWLNKDRINATNGRFSITSFIATDIEAGVPETLLDWLQKSGSDTVTLTQTGTNLLAVSGRSRVNFATLDPKRQLESKHPETTNKAPIDTAFIQALSNISISLDPKSDEPSKLGVFI